jgi:hypothetical protein
MEFFYHRKPGKAAPVVSCPMIQYCCPAVSVGWDEEVNVTMDGVKVMLDELNDSSMPPGRPVVSEIIKPVDVLKLEVRGAG